MNSINKETQIKISTLTSEYEAILALFYSQMQQQH